MSNSGNQHKGNGYHSSNGGEYILGNWWHSIHFICIAVEGDLRHHVYLSATDTVRQSTVMLLLRCHVVVIFHCILLLSYVHYILWCVIVSLFHIEAFESLLCVYSFTVKDLNMAATWVTYILQAGVLFNSSKQWPCMMYICKRVVVNFDRQIPDTIGVRTEAYGIPTTYICSWLVRELNKYYPYSDYYSVKRGSHKHGQETF